MTPFDPFTLDFSKSPDGLLPGVVLHSQTGRLLMVGYLNRESLHRTLEIGKVTFFSRSRNELWTKGDTSGNFLNLVTIAADCDSDALLIYALPDGPVCHTGADTCFGEPKDSPLDFLLQLESVLTDRKNNPRPDSHTSQMFAAGIKRMAQKVGEEATEVVLEAMDNSPEHFLNESADLLYRLVSLWVAKGVGVQDVIEVLKKRR